MAPVMQSNFPCHVRLVPETGAVLEGHLCLYGQHWVKLIKIRDDGMPETVVSMPRERVAYIQEDPMLAERNRPLLQRFNDLQAQLKASQQAPAPQAQTPMQAAYAQPTGERTLDELG